MLGDLKSHMSAASARVKGAAIAARDKATDTFNEVTEAARDRLTHPNIAYERGVRQALDAIHMALEDGRPIDMILLDGIAAELEEDNPY